MCDAMVVMTHPGVAAPERRARESQQPMNNTVGCCPFSTKDWNCFLSRGK